MKIFQGWVLSFFMFCFMADASCQQASDSTGLSNEQFKQMTAAGEVDILDVRTASEFSDGHIPRARNMDVLQPDAFKKSIASLPKNKSYVLYCRSGKRSATALRIMQEMGFPHVKHLKNGFAGWDGDTAN